ncbi:MAG: Gfo/Idh/MocA family oxidoreductase, partial [Spirochaetales bacterium]|nr:Gfo/Idh/MocA family oxidoreductase [Spirochaetales bacterium]
AEMVVAFAEAGVPVIYCEKPIAPTVDEADRMLQACRSSGALLVINHNRRFNKNYRRLRALIAKNGLGDLTSVTARWASGRLGNVGTHIFDAVRMLTGRAATGVSGTLDKTGKADCRGEEFHDPGGWGLIRLGGGCMVTVDAADYAKCPMTIEIQGSLGTASIIGSEINLSFFTGKTEKWTEDSSSGSSMDEAVREIVEWLDARSLDGAVPEFSYDPREAVDVLETIAAFHASHVRSGAWVDLPLTAEDRVIPIRSG